MAAFSTAAQCALLYASKQGRVGGLGRASGGTWRQLSYEYGPTPTPELASQAMVRVHVPNHRQATRFPLTCGTQCDVAWFPFCTRPNTEHVSCAVMLLARTTHLS